VCPAASPNYKKLDRKVIRSSFQEFEKVWHHLKGMKILKRYLYAFFFYSMGVQTIMLVAASFGEKILHLGTSKLIATVLVIQLVAILGAYLMSYMARRIGNIIVLSLVLLVWIAICGVAYYISNETQFYITAAVIGMIMGGVQSLSRSTYSKFIPEESPDTASFFSFYDVTEKVAIVIGLISFGYIEEFTGSMRNSALSMAIFFIIGLVLLLSMLGIKSPLLKEQK
jgi:UMF1 family MFS transporter